jgi:multicomponent Na+:H+ antiporter subunit D
MIDGLTPAVFFIAGGLLAPFLHIHALRILMLALPVAGLVQLYGLDPADAGAYHLVGLDLITLRIDALGLVFATIFHIVSFILALYALHERDRLQHAAMLMTAGGAIGASLAGDLITLFLFWEVATFASVFLIWAQRTERACGAGMRFLLFQGAAGLLLLSGAVLLLSETGSLAFSHMRLESLATWSIFLGFGVKCAFPLLHNWLADAYPEATVTGAPVLASFSTKLAIYALARGFSGEELLITIGAVMAVFPMFYALIENDLRRVLCYSLNNQLGFMLVGIGVGGALAVNGAIAHAVTNILFKGLLLMSVGAVMLRAGSARASDLGGLYKSMPWTTGFCLVGAASISAFPLFAGFVSKGMILAATAESGHWLVWLALMFAAAGILHYTGAKIPYFAFFGQDRGVRCQEAPGNMLAAMGLAAGLCLLIGIYPPLLYGMLPYEVEFVSYTFDHVVTQMQLLLFSALAFAFLVRKGIYPSALRSVNLDTDWFYRRLLPAIGRYGERLLTHLTGGLRRAGEMLMRQGFRLLYRVHGPRGVLARTVPGSVTMLWVLVLLAGVLVLYYV